MVLITTTEIKLTVLFKAWADLSNPQARRLVMEVRSSQADPVFWWSTPLLAAAFPSLEGSVCTRSQQSQLA